MIYKVKASISEAGGVYLVLQIALVFECDGQNAMVCSIKYCTKI